MISLRVLLYLTDFNTVNLRTISVQFTKGKGIHVPLKEESFSFQTGDNNKSAEIL